MDRHKTRKIKIGNIYIGGDAPISVQSMTKTDTRDAKSTVVQIKKLQEEGCEIIRCAAPDMEAAKSLGRIKRSIKIPLVADIHFDWRLAIEAIKQGVDKIRINPGNIEKKTDIEKIVKAAKDAKIPIRIGINAGSLKSLHIKHYDTSQRANSMVYSALEYVKMLENMDFYDIIISLKASDVPTTIQAYRLMAKKSTYPLHLGITEAGTKFFGTIKSSVGMGTLLAEGIGDTIRVSLTDNPVEEVRIGYQILSALQLRHKEVEIISCPTCGRCEVDIIGITREVERDIFQSHVIKKFKNRKEPLKIAIMGCVVNGPGEAKTADIGIAGSKKFGILFKQGKVIKKIKEKDFVRTLMEEIKNME